MGWRTAVLQGQKLHFYPGERERVGKKVFGKYLTLDLDTDFTTKPKIRALKLV